MRQQELTGDKKMVLLVSILINKLRTIRNYTHNFNLPSHFHLFFLVSSNDKLFCSYPSISQGKLRVSKVLVMQ